MSSIPPDARFERKGRPLGHWLRELVSPDAKIRKEAGEVVLAMYEGVLSLDIDCSELDRQAGEEDAAAWQQAVREEIDRPDFPRHSFFTAAAAQLISAQAEYMKELSIDNEQLDRICDRLGERLKASTTEEERQQHLARLNRALFASLARGCEDDADDIEAFSNANISLRMVLPAAGPAILDTPEALWLLIESSHDKQLAYSLIEKVGPPAAPEFLNHLVELFSARGRRWHDCQPRALAAVGRGNLDVIEMLLHALETWPVEGAWSASSTLHLMGESARKHQQALPTLLRVTEAAEGQRRAAVAHALGGVARGIDDAIEPLLKLTYDTHRDEEGYGGHIVAGYAITALGEIGRQPERVVPRLIETFDTFEEFDSDMGYGGAHARQCAALGTFGKAASTAVPTLIDQLNRDRAKSPEDWCHDDLLDLLGSFGSDAEEAIPLLESMDQAWIKYCDEEELQWEEDEDEDEDEDDDEDDDFLEDEKEASDYRTTLQRIQGKQSY